MSEINLLPRSLPNVNKYFLASLSLNGSLRYLNNVDLTRESLIMNEKSSMMDERHSARRSLPAFDNVEDAMAMGRPTMQMVEHWDGPNS